MMPPQGMPQPAPDVRASFVAALERSLDNLAAADPFPGRSSFRRLNRAEYANVIRDLLALEIDPATYLPPDELVYGFDNIGDALALSTSLLESYSAAAAQIATLAVGDVAGRRPRFYGVSHQIRPVAERSERGAAAWHRGRAAGAASGAG